MTDTRIPEELAERVAESVRHALQLVGHAENGFERDRDRDTVDAEETAVS